MNDSEDERDEKDYSFTPKNKTPCIFEGEWTGDVLAQGFDSIILTLDGRVNSSLEWKESSQLALKAIELGYAILWKLDLGLFDYLPYPLDNQMQFLSLTLALENFRDFIWKDFREHSLGLFFYEGNADFSQGFKWEDQHEFNLKEWLKQIDESDLALLDLYEIRTNEKGSYYLSLFCRDVIIDYLELLASRLPDTIPLYLCLDVSSLSGQLMKQISYLNLKALNRFHLILKNSELSFEEIGWKKAQPKGYLGKTPSLLPVVKEIKIGISIPLASFYPSLPYEELAVAISQLHQNQWAYKLISEEELLSKWSGLDWIIYTPKALTSTGKRMLQGFCAAGGTAVTTSELSHLANEMLLTEWLEEKNNLVKNYLN